ncbi:MAG: hypothetical protein M3Q10_02655 [Chloroflexota bacterium]|nr:hypothetical protein [Chloroflexota bacterium]
MIDARRRRGNDACGGGIGAGGAFAPEVNELRAVRTEPGWIVEEPEIHLAPHLCLA